MATEGPLVEVTPVITPEELEIVRELFREYAASLETDLEYQGFSGELQSLPGAYRPPLGGLFIARVDGSPAGCVALRPLQPPICEMKRLYVRTTHRGAGVGPRLVEAAIAAARAGGYEQMWLDTLSTMASAQRLYERLGFREIPAYGSAIAPGSRFYGLSLAQN